MAIRYLKNNAKQVALKTVLLRLDVNEPISDKGKLLDDFRLQSAIPTIKFLREQKCRVVIVAHLGRPKGKHEPEMCLRPVAHRLAELLHAKFSETDDRIPNYPVNHLIFFTGDISKDRTRFNLRNVPHKDIVFLENVRFYKGEETNDPKFSKMLSELADVYVNDAFGSSHRTEASIVGVTKYLPSFAGLQMQKEIAAMDYIMRKSKAPFVLMTAGMKLDAKLKALENLAEKADKILLGGVLANLFLQVRGMDAFVPKEYDSIKRKIFQLEKNFKNKIVLPEDVVVTDFKLQKKFIKVLDVHKLTERDLVVDIGPKTILRYSRELKLAKTIVWNGPLGKFEVKPFDTGTMALAKVVGGVSSGRCFGVAGGGETVDAVRLAGQADYLDHLSTGGGAMLSYLAGEKLPGILALENK